MIMNDMDVEKYKNEYHWIPRRQVYILMTVMLLVGMIFFKIKILSTKVQFGLAIILWFISVAIYPSYILKANRKFKGTVGDFIVALLCVSAMILIATFFLEPSYIDVFPKFIEIKNMAENEAYKYAPHLYITLCSVSVFLTSVMGLFGKERIHGN